MVWLRNEVYQGANKRQSTYDVCYVPSSSPKPVVIFAHGYKGFKDWGCWGLVAERFAQHGFLFVKFNFSHNGGTVKKPIDFPDLKAFANNRYSYELADINTIVSQFSESKSVNNQLIDGSSINIIGHSRGGAIVLLFAANTIKLNRISTWAAVSNLASRFYPDVNMWKKEGVYYVENGRTKQQMPHNYTFYTDYFENQSKLNLSLLLPNIKADTLIIHGEQDEVVLPIEAEVIVNNVQKGILKLIPNASHTFGAKHPWEENSLPKPLREVVDNTIAFFKTH